MTIATTAQADHTNRDIAIILGSFFGALIFVLAFFILLFLIFKRKIPIRKGKIKLIIILFSCEYTIVDFSMRRFKMGNTAEIGKIKKVNDNFYFLYFRYGKK